MDLLREDFGLVHPGPFLGGGFPFGVAVFQRCPVGIALGTIQTAIGDHINSSVARDHGLIGHGFFIYESIIRKGGISLPLSARINCFNFKWKGLSRLFNFCQIGLQLSIPARSFDREC